MSNDLTSANLIIDSRLSVSPLNSIPKEIRPVDQDAAYSVQETVHEILSETHQRRRIGYKIGCTTPIMQKNLGITHPCAGGISDTTVFREKAELRLADFTNVGVECEIGVVLARDLKPIDGMFNLSVIENNISAVMAAIEIVDDRYTKAAKNDVMTLIADDFYGAGAILGPQIHHWSNLDLSKVTGRVYINGREKDSGIGAAVMGHPLEAVLWLANLKLHRGEILKGGEFILTGSLTLVQWIEEPCEVKIDIDDLGTITGTFT